MLDTVRQIYRQSLKSHDSLWNNWVSRPPAAVIVWLLRPLSVTPNQVTFASVTLFAVAAAILIAWPTYPGLVVAALTIQASYVLDCVDGQLARVKSMSSPVGALLDFLMDEVKAFLLVAASAVRLWRTSGDDRWLLGGLGGLCVVASGIALTTFMRRQEYLEAVAAKPRGDGAPASRPSLIGRFVRGVEWLGRFVIQYPAHIWLFFVADRLDYFLVVYLGAHTAYLGRAGLVVLVKLGQPRRSAS